MVPAEWIFLSNAREYSGKDKCSGAKRFTKAMPSSRRAGQENRSGFLDGNAGRIRVRQGFQLRGNLLLHLLGQSRCCGYKIASRIRRVFRLSQHIRGNPARVAILARQRFRWARRKINCAIGAHDLFGCCDVAIAGTERFFARESMRFVP